LQQFEYGRSGNPSRQVTETCIASLEKGEQCKFCNRCDIYSVISHLTLVGPSKMRLKYPHAGD